MEYAQTVYEFLVGLSISLVLLILYQSLISHGAKKLFVFKFFFFGLLWGLLGAKMIGSLGYFTAYEDWSFAPTSVSGFLLFFIPYLFRWVRDQKTRPLLSAKVRAAQKLSWALPLAQSIGRIGCYCAGCCPGPWALSWPLIESGFCLVLALFLMKFSKAHSAYQSLVFYVLAYGSGRFLLDFYRVDLLRGYWGQLSIPQWVIAALFLWLFLDWRRKGDFNQSP